MAYDQVKVWDGTNPQKINPAGGMQTGSATVRGTTIVATGLSAILLGATNLTRTTLSVFNLGTSSIRLGTDSTLTNATGFANLASGSNRDMFDYNGAIYGIILNGVSGNVQNIGVLDIG